MSIFYCQNYFILGSLDNAKNAKWKLFKNHPISTYLLWLVIHILCFLFPFLVLFFFVSFFFSKTCAIRKCKKKKKQKKQNKTKQKQNKKQIEMPNTTFLSGGGFSSCHSLPPFASLHEGNFDSEWHVPVFASFRSQALARHPRYGLHFRSHHLSHPSARGRNN